MGHRIKEIRDLRSQNIGAECSKQSALDIDDVHAAVRAACDLTKLSERSKGMLARYAYDMNSVLAEISRVLRRDGEAVIVVGNSTIRGVFIKNSRALAYLAKANGLRLNSIRRRRLLENRRYLPPAGKEDFWKATWVTDERRSNSDVWQEPIDQNQTCRASANSLAIPAWTNQYKKGTDINKLAPRETDIPTSCRSI